jgi:hypothetical protein
VLALAELLKARTGGPPPVGLRHGRRVRDLPDELGRHARREHRLSLGDTLDGVDDHRRHRADPLHNHTASGSDWAHLAVNTLIWVVLTLAFGAWRLIGSEVKSA